MTREDILKALHALVQNENLRRHGLAAGACMRAIAVYLKEKDKKKYKDIDENVWEMVGFLHDADYERTKDRPVEHGMIVVDEVRSFGFELPPDAAQAIKFHNFENTHAEESLMGWAIYTCDELTGLIVACTLVRPDKKIASVTPEFVMEKYQQKDFAKGALRERIALCQEKLDISLEDYIKICLKAMQDVANELGL